MTNNDELALKLKSAADAWKNADEKYDRAEITISDFISAADQYNGIIKDPANILSLLAERDADKKVIADSVVLFETLRQRIAELEARTVSVKWPDDGMDDCYDLWGAEQCRNNFDCGYNFSAVRHEQAIREALAAAGIKLEVGE